jgi:hypothetical protein
MRRLILAGAVVVAAAGCCAGPAAAADVNSATVVQEVRQAALTTPAGQTRRFADGLYDAQNGDVYVDGNPDAVWRLSVDRLVPAPTPDTTSAAGILRPLEACGYVTYFHCEHTLEKSGCIPTTFYKNYIGDDFSDPYGAKLNPPEQVSVRDAPYRNYGARGVRAYHDGVYGFYSDNCVDP